MKKEGRKRKEMQAGRMLNLSRIESRAAVLLLFSTSLAFFSTYIFAFDLVEGAITYLLALGVAIMAASVLSGKYRERKQVGTCSSDEVCATAQGYFENARGGLKAGCTQKNQIKPRLRYAGEGM